MRVNLHRIGKGGWHLNRKTDVFLLTYALIRGELVNTSPVSGLEVGEKKKKIRMLVPFSTLGEENALPDDFYLNFSLTFSSFNSVLLPPLLLHLCSLFHAAGRTSERCSFCSSVSRFPSMN